MNTESRKFAVCVVFWSSALFALGCGQSLAPTVDSAQVAHSHFYSRFTPAASSKRSRVPSSFVFVVPEDVQNIFKRKCYICHGGADVRGGFDLKKMVYQPKPESQWQPMDLAGVTRIKLAILPLNGKPPRMPKRAGSILNQLTTKEANGIAKWTDYPYER